jgi:hypothetical protein
MISPGRDGSSTRGAPPSYRVGYVYARDIGSIFRVAEAMEAGMVGVNDGVK